MLKRFIPILFLLQYFASATVLKPEKSCMDYKVPATVSSSNYVFAPSFEDDYQLVDFITDLTSRDNSTFNPFTGQKNQTKSYIISGTYCTPKGNSDHKSTLLLLSHGLGFDRR